MKKYCISLLCILAFNAQAQAPVPGLSVSNNNISWANTQGWMQVQNPANNFKVVPGCEGMITSCTVPEAGVYQLTDHTNGLRSQDIRVERAGCKATYTLPNDGAWYQLQKKPNYNTVCHSMSQLWQWRSGIALHA